MFELFRREKCDFFKLLGEQAELTLAGIEALISFFRDRGEENAGKLLNFENKADEARRILIDELNKTFATPMDREDIFALSRVIDDIIDYGKSTVDELKIFGMSPNDYLIKMGDILAKGTREINQGVSRLQKNPNISNEHAVRAKNYENQMESVYREALVDLFKGNDVIYMLKMREVYRHMSNAADRCDEAANIISDIVVKMT